VPPLPPPHQTRTLETRTRETFRPPAYDVLGDRYSLTVDVNCDAPLP
jgi:hypothetical protein